MEEVQQLGYPSYATVKHKMTRMVKEKLIKHLGAIQWNAEGRPIDVFGTWKPSGGHLMHEVLLSKFLLPRWLSGATCKRGYDVEQTLRPDGELSFDGETYFVELDRVTEPMWQLKKRLVPYGTQSRIVLIVTPYRARIRQIQKALPDMNHCLLMTTTDEARGKSVCEWIAIDGRTVML